MDESQTKVFRASLTSHDMIHIGVATSGIGMLVEEGKITAADLHMSEEELKRFIAQLRITDKKLEFILVEITSELEKGQSNPPDHAGTWN